MTEVGVARVKAHRFLNMRNSRVRLTEIVQTEPYLKAHVKPVEDEDAEQGVETEALLRNAQSLFQRVVELAPQLPQEVAMAFANITEPGRVADFAAANLNLNTAERQELHA